MHHSRLFGIFVDAPLDQSDRAATFWAGALGVTATPGDPFTGLPGAIAGFVMEVQAVDDAPRYHLDIETDDVAAETERLIGLGASELRRQDGFVVLRAPGGHLFCVVPVQSDRAVFDAGARSWPS